MARCQIHRRKRRLPERVLDAHGEARKSTSAKKVTTRKTVGKAAAKHKHARLIRDSFRDGYRAAR